MPTAVAAPPLALQLQTVLSELHGFVSDIQRPRLGDGPWMEAICAGGAQLTESVAGLQRRLGEQLAEQQATLDPALDRIKASLTSYAAEVAQGQRAQQMQRLYVSLSRDYEELRLRVRRLAAIHRPAMPRIQPLKPIRWVRSAVHVGLGVGSAALYHWVLDAGQATALLLSLLVVFASLEISRKFSRRWNDLLVDKVFGLISRPFERHHVNGSTWFLLAMVAILLAFRQPATELGLLILALADPAASVVGKLFGRKKLYGEKSVLGTLVFFGVALAVAVGYQAAFLPAASGLGLMIVRGVAIAAVGTTVELYSGSVDDNFSIPILCAGAAHFIL